MPLIDFNHVASHLEDVTPEQIGRCHKVIGPDNHAFYQVENESGDLDEHGAIIEYTVRYTLERGFSCTCKSGQEGFSNVRHWSGVCKHVRWSVKCELELRGALAELAEQTDATTTASAAPLDGEATRAHSLEIDGKTASTFDYARILSAQPTQYNEEAIKRDQARYAPRAFRVIDDPEA
jgi:hypothetical protein